MNFVVNDSFNVLARPAVGTYYNVMYSTDGGTTIQYCSVKATSTSPSSTTWTSMYMYSSPQSGAAGTTCKSYFAKTTSGTPYNWGLSDYQLTSGTQNTICKTSSGVFFNSAHYPSLGQMVAITSIQQWYYAPILNYPWCVTTTGQFNIICSYTPTSSGFSASVQSNALTLPDFYKREVLLNHSDFNIQHSFYSQQIRLGVGTSTDLKALKYWAVGENNEVTTKGQSDSALLTVEQSPSNSQEVLISTKNKTSYIHAVNLLPYVVLMFGASRSTATPFQVTFAPPLQTKFVTEFRLVLSTADIKGTGVHTWLTNSEFVFLMKGSPTNYINDDKVLLTLVQEGPEHKQEYTEHKKESAEHKEEHKQEHKEEHKEEHKKT